MSRQLRDTHRSGEGRGINGKNSIGICFRSSNDLCSGIGKWVRFGIPASRKHYAQYSLRHGVCNPDTYTTTG